MLFLEECRLEQMLLEAMLRRQDNGRTQGLNPWQNKQVLIEFKSDKGHFLKFSISQ